MIGISYLVFTHNEGSEYLNALFGKLMKFTTQEDEIIVVDDNSDDPATLEVLKNVYNMDGDAGRPGRVCTFYKHPLNNNFAEHKNFGKSKCTKPYIFQIDGDETFHDNLVLTLKEVLLLNPTVDLFRVPRINIVQSLTPEHISRWGWHVNDKGYVNFPDYQDRIFKNVHWINWENKVHEKITGHTSHSELPAVEDYCLLHIKSILRQEAQNSFYNTI